MQYIITMLAFGSLRLVTVGVWDMPAQVLRTVLRSVHFAGASSASHQSSTLRSSLDDLDAAGPTPSPPVDVPGGGLRRAAASNQPLQFGKAQQQQQPYTRLVSLVSVKR